MRKRLLLIAALAALLVAGYALAAGVTVTLTATGPQPAQLTVNWGDTVTFVNGGARPYQLAIPRLTVETPPLQPGQTFEQVFNGRGGNYGIRQMGGGPNRPGLILVEVKGTVTLAAKPTSLAWGSSVRFTGTSSIPGTPVNLVAYRLGGGGAGWTQVATTTAAEDGAFSFDVKPESSARYRVQIAADQLRSDTLLISVKPIVTARAAARRTKAGRVVRITARVNPANAATQADLQRLDPRRSRWISEQRRRVSRAGVATFRWKAVKGTTRLRVALLPLSLATGWAATESKPVTVRGM